MMPLEPVTLSFGAAAVLGLSFGSGPCNIACLPYLGPVFMATDNGVRGAWRILLPFSLGRILSYALLAAIAGWAGVLVQDWIDAPWVRWLLGAATIGLGLSLLMRRNRCATSCSVASTPGEVLIDAPVPNARAPLMPGTLFFMGMGLALNPCIPLSTIMLASATGADALTGLTLGLGFGLGAVLIPSLVFGLGMAHFGAQVRINLNQWRRPLESGSIALLLVVGAGTALGWITP